MKYFVCHLCTYFIYLSMHINFYFIPSCQSSSLSCCLFFLSIRRSFTYCVYLYCSCMHDVIIHYDDFLKKQILFFLSFPFSCSMRVCQRMLISFACLIWCFYFSLCYDYSIFFLLCFSHHRWLFFVCLYHLNYS